MKTIALELIAASPLAIRSDHAPGGTETATIIPGSTLVGCLAATHRMLRPEHEVEFARFFLSGEIQYPHLYPASFKASELQWLDSPIYPLPQTAQSCKRFPGFPKLASEKKQEERHGVRDNLLDWAMFRLGEKAGYSARDLSRLLEPQKYCTYQMPGEGDQESRCEMSLEHLTGYYRREDFTDEEGGQPEKVSRGKAYVDTRLQMHTGINRERGTVEDGVLYSRQVIEEGMHFWGVIKLPDDAELSAAFGRFIAQIHAEDVLNEDKHRVRGLVRVGTGRTRGMGKVHLNFKPAQESLDAESRYQRFKRRLEAFNHALSTRAQTHKLPCGKFSFALTLHSPAILTDEALRYRGNVSAASLANLARPAKLVVKDDPLPFELLYQVASGRRITGWQELWGTPKTNEYALESGSVFLFTCLLDLDEDWLRAFFALEEQGIGKRREEGFGRICFSDPFHLEGIVP